MDREDHAFALPERDDLDARLHARPLLGEHELAAGEIGARLGEQDRYLQGEDALAIEGSCPRRWCNRRDGAKPFAKRAP
jgi:hypothetical protein